MTARPGPVTAQVRDVEGFRDLVARRLGLLFEDAKLGFLGDVLRRRLESGAEDVPTYLARLEKAPTAEEIGFLAQALTVPETYFFRNIDQFHALARAALPERIRARRTQRTLRLLSAGCASGDEAFSMAIAVREYLPHASSDVSIRGVDLNPVVLQRAEQARFTEWALRETPEQLRRKWFQPEGREFILEASLRGAVEFEQRNLSLDDPQLWPGDHYDVIFCRNVIMYFTPESAHALIARMTRALAPGGYLFLGHAETLRGLSQDFHLQHTHGTFYYQRKDGAQIATAHPGGIESRRDSSASSLTTIVDDAGSWVDAIQRAAHRIQVLARSAAAGPAATLTPRPRWDLGSALDLLRRERFSDALDAVYALPPESVRDPDVLMLEAVLLTHSGQLEQARGACQRLLAVDELNAGAHYILALCLEAEGDRRGAADHDQIAVYLDPTFAMPRLHLGLLARRAADRAKARRELNQALLLLQREDASRLLLFGGGFGRETLIALCSAELGNCADRA